MHPIYMHMAKSLKQIAIYVTGFRETDPNC